MYDIWRWIMAMIVTYRGEMFILGLIEKGKGVITTSVWEKAIRHGFTISQRGYKKLVNLNEIIEIKPYTRKEDRYRVKYKEHFFEVNFDTEDKVEIAATGELAHPLATIYDMDEDYYDLISTKFVYKKDIIPINKIVNRRLGLYKNIVCDIIEEKKNRFMLSMNIDLTAYRWKIVNGRSIKTDDALGWKRYNKYNGLWTKWVSKEDVYVYTDAKEPLRY